MKTPIFDFAKQYSKDRCSRFHMPGHKGVSIIGSEKYDITEFEGADSLYNASGIIKISEEIASNIFGANTYYSTEGSSLCIRAMLYLVKKFAATNGENAKILAARNVHNTFLSAAALLDIDVQWLKPQSCCSYLSCNVTAKDIESYLTNSSKMPTALYITTPDYLGNMLDIKSISDICHKHNILLLVDNAHGAYLKFLSESLHPIDLGADICCDSAHKTLPCLTGGAYLHISKSADSFFCSKAKEALSLFGSTSPSYLILESLDLVNKYISKNYKLKLNKFVQSVEAVKSRLIDHGFKILNSDPLKITIMPKEFGYSGKDLAEILIENKIVCEYYDQDFVVLMLTPLNKSKDLIKLERVLRSTKRKDPIITFPPQFSQPNKKMSINNAYFADSYVCNVDDLLGKVVSKNAVSCPPAVPIIMSGEEIDQNTIKAFKYYGIESCEVIK